MKQTECNHKEESIIDVCNELVAKLENTYPKREHKRRTRKETLSPEEWRFWCDEHQ